MKRIAAMAWVGSIPLDERQRVKENPDYPMRDRLNLQIAQHTLRQGGKVTPEPQMVWYSTPWDRFWASLNGQEKYPFAIYDCC